MVVITGLTPEPGKIDATSEPIIERFDPATGTGVGIHYQGDLAPAKRWRWCPATNAGSVRDGGIDRADAIPGRHRAGQPDRPRPLGRREPPPPGRVVDLQQTEDRHLWAAVNSGGAGSLWRSSGSGWSEELGGACRRCAACCRSATRCGSVSTTGLSRLEIQPGGGVRARSRSLDTDRSSGQRPCGRSSGQCLGRDRPGTRAARIGRADLYRLGNRSETETPLRALWIDASGDVYAGGELGLFLHRTAHERFYILLDEKVDEADDDWLALDLSPATLPDPATIFVPPVHAVMHGPDTHIWLGTAQGIARYRAREQRRTYTTLLEAMPQLTETPVTQIRSDARGRLWFATGEGLFVYDQLDWFQRQGDALVRLPRRTRTRCSRCFWRYVRGSSRWQSSPHRAAPASRTTRWPARQQRAGGPLDRLDRDGAGAPRQLRRRPSRRRSRHSGRTGDALQTGADAHRRRRHRGGAAAAERRSNWRYLQREEPTPPTPVATPAWTREGRLMPPPPTARRRSRAAIWLTSPRRRANRVSHTTRRAGLVRLVAAGTPFRHGAAGAHGTGRADRSDDPRPGLERVAARQAGRGRGLSGRRRNDRA